MRERALTIAIGLAVALVLARSAVFLLWEQATFDSDQAVFGLMATHLAEGRAFPMFIYGDRYLLAVQSWMAAPLFAVAGPSVAALKVPLVLVNIATAVLLVWILHRDGKLHPMLALVASLFFALAPLGMSGSLMETAGGNPEPFLYVLLLWLLRDRPLAFGVLFAFGFIHREFTIYGVTAIIAIAWLADRRINRQRLTAVALAAIAYLVVAQAARTAFLFSTPFGPGTTVGVGGGFDNVTALGARACVAPETFLPALSRLFGHLMGVPFGAVEYPLRDHAVRSTLASTPFTFWPVLGGLFAAALSRVTWISVRDRKAPWTGPAAIGLFLLLVGLQAGVAYALTRCGRVELGTIRYALLMLYAGVGTAALYFIVETSVAGKRAMAAGILVWAAISAFGHVQLAREYLYREPMLPQRALADYLVDHDIRYARSDYWTAYTTTFLSGERVIVASTDTVRITEYQQAVDANRTSAVTVARGPCRAGTGVEVVAGTYWICPP